MLILGLGLLFFVCGSCHAFADCIWLRRAYTTRAELVHPAPSTSHRSESWSVMFLIFRKRKPVVAKTTRPRTPKFNFDTHFGNRDDYAWRG